MHDECTTAPTYQVGAGALPGGSGT